MMFCAKTNSWHHGKTFASSREEAHGKRGNQEEYRASEKIFHFNNSSKCRFHRQNRWIETRDGGYTVAARNGFNLIEGTSWTTQYF